MTPNALAALATLAAILFAPADVRAQAAGTPGDFDFYVLSLSWSSSYCAKTGDARNDTQCSLPLGFVVHGLWPQYDRGYPNNCHAGFDRPSVGLARRQLDLFPSIGLVLHEWQVHGTCSGLAPDAYFDAARLARKLVAIPDPFQAPTRLEIMTTSEIERTFLAANPGLGADEIAIKCDDKSLSEVEICLAKDLTGFVTCPEVDRRGCSRSVQIPPIRSRH